MHFDDVAVGQELPPFERAITTYGIVAYQGATWDFHRFHHDAEFARANGSPAPFVDGQMLGALLATHVMTWAGPDAFLRRLTFRFRSMVYAGDTLVSRGAVTETAAGDGVGTVTCSLVMTTTDGREVMSPCTAVIELPARGTS
ncbi:MAG: MaoC/PaaZ C-terminal domain-containing protein [Dehalococcoidia bacterium]